MKRFMVLPMLLLFCAVSAFGNIKVGVSYTLDKGTRELTVIDTSVNEQVTIPTLDAKEETYEWIETPDKESSQNENQSDSTLSKNILLLIIMLLVMIIT